MTDDFWSSTSSSNALDVPAFLDSSVTTAIGELVSLGVLVSLGLTRDGGALGVTIFDNGRKRREYFRRSEDCADWCQLAAAALSGTGFGATANGGPVGQKPTRGV